MKTVNDIIKENAKKFGNLKALTDEYSNYSLTYGEFWRDINKFAFGLKKLGFTKEDTVALFSENSSKWMVTDRATALSGAINVVRGSGAPIDELKYIYNHSDSTVLVTDSLSVLENMSDYLCSKGSNFAIYIGNGKLNKEKYSICVYDFFDVLNFGEEGEFPVPEMSEDDVATLIYSSGTTGRPKGIVLTRKNILSQIEAIHPALQIMQNKSVLNILPIWHAYERTCEYYLISRGTHFYYTNIKNFKKDLKKYAPHYLVSVPRLFEAVYDGIYSELNKKSKNTRKIFDFFFEISRFYTNCDCILHNLDLDNINPSLPVKAKAYCGKILSSGLNSIAQKVIFSKIRDAFGKNFIKGISGGGAMAKYVDEFFRSVGIDVYVGYGLTETAPVVAVRAIGDNKVCATGRALMHTEIIIVDKETLKPLPKGQKGLVLVKGPQVMKGYYKDEEATKKVLLGNGFFNTGDIGYMTQDDCLVLTGRAKDIIVLSNGENIEPDIIEQTCMSLPFIKQIVLVGQDKNSLGAIVVPEPEALEAFAKSHGMSLENNMPEIKKAVLKEIQKKVTSRSNYRTHEMITDIILENEAFTPQNGLMTMTAKIKKNEVFDKYKEKIEAMYV